MSSKQLVEKVSSGVSMIGKLTATVGAFGLSPPLGWLAYSAFFVPHQLPLGPALSAERKTMKTRRSQTLSYYVDREAPGVPLLLIHSIHAAASALDVRPLFDRYRKTRPVYAVDLPGFGFSDRDERDYTRELFADGIVDVLTRIKSQTGSVADVVALGYGGEFSAMAAVKRRDLFRSLAIVSPTSLGVNREKGAPLRARIQSLATKPIWAQGVFDLIASRPLLHRTLKRQFQDGMDVEVEQYAYATTHQPGARYAPLSLLSGALADSESVERAYELLEIPVLMLHPPRKTGDRDPFADLAEANAHVHAVQVASFGPMLHVENPATFDQLETFWTSMVHAHVHTHN